MPYLGRQDLRYLLHEVGGLLPDGPHRQHPVPIHDRHETRQVARAYQAELLEVLIELEDALVEPLGLLDLPLPVAAWRHVVRRDKSAPDDRDRRDGRGIR